MVIRFSPNPKLNYLLSILWRLYEPRIPNLIIVCASSPKFGDAMVRFVCRLLDLWSGVPGFPILWWDLKKYSHWDSVIFAKKPQGAVWVFISEILQANFKSPCFRKHDFRKQDFPELILKVRGVSFRKNLLSVTSNAERARTMVVWMKNKPRKLVIWRSSSRTARE